MKKCRGSHQGHLCVLASNAAWERIKRLVSRPRFVCFNCGRAANRACNLCNPMPLAPSAASARKTAR